MIIKYAMRNKPKPEYAFLTTMGKYIFTHPEFLYMDSFGSMKFYEWVCCKHPFSAKKHK